jgi:Zn ribbon nucleic-acid-binding protein
MSIISESLTYYPEDCAEFKKDPIRVEQQWACDCSVAQIDGNNAGVFECVKVNSEGQCLKCGYYAKRVDKNLLKRIELLKKRNSHVSRIKQLKRKKIHAK